MKYVRSILLAATLLLALAGCGKDEEPAEAVMAEVSIREAITEADPQAAVDAIYAMLPDARTEPLTAVEFENLFEGLDEAVKAYYGCTSDPGGGLADIIIFEPREGSNEADRSYRDVAHDALRLYQEQRVREFENYDILDSFSIASKAEVYVQGDYVILLMLAEEEIETARQIIDQYIPL